MDEATISCEGGDGVEIIDRAPFSDECPGLWLGVNRRGGFVAINAAGDQLFVSDLDIGISRPFPSAPERAR
jgi:hypothetical protein